MTLRSGACRAFYTLYFILYTPEPLSMWRLARPPSQFAVLAPLVFATARTLHAPRIFVTDDAPVHDVPMSVIKRPLPSALDEGKVVQFMQNIQNGTDMTPIEVAWVQRPEGNYYFAFGGCHRWEAHKRLGKASIRAKVIKVSPGTISTFLGASNPFRD